MGSPGRNLGKPGANGAQDGQFRLARDGDSARARRQRYRFEAEGKTDQAGRFRFSNLPAERHCVCVTSGAEQADRFKENVATPAKGTNMEIRVVVLDWITLKPVPPSAGD